MAVLRLEKLEKALAALNAHKLTTDELLDMVSREPAIKINPIALAKKSDADLEKILTDLYEARLKVFTNDFMEDDDPADILVNSDPPTGKKPVTTTATVDPAPIIESLTKAIEAGKPSRVMVTGKNFKPGCVVTFNGVALPTSSSKTQASVTLIGDEFPSGGMSLVVEVVNPDDQVSNHAYLMVTNPAPVAPPAPPTAEKKTKAQLESELKVNMDAYSASGGNHSFLDKAVAIMAELATLNVGVTEDLTRKLEFMESIYANHQTPELEAQINEARKALGTTSKKDDKGAVASANNWLERHGWVGLLGSNPSKKS